MGLLFSGIGGLCLLGSLVCFVLVVIKMFQHGDQTLGIITLVSLLACGLGILIAYIMGWVNNAKYDASQLMLAWTGCIIIGILSNVLAVVFGAPPAFELNIN